jgi:hypothetical protein
MNFYTLIHICKDEQSLHNNSFVKSFKEQVNLYFSCAKQLHRSLRTTGIKLTVLTNDRQVLQELNTDDYDIDIVQLDFNLDVPSGIKFYSAHFKIEVFSYLSTFEDDYIGLLDCDMVCINAMPECLKNAVENKVPLYYDITDQMVPAFTAKRIIADKQRLSTSKSVGLWAGGEFIAGPPSFFGQLFTEIDSLKQAYFTNFNSFQHQGDEMLTSVAIENMMLKGDVRMMDAGALSMIARYWSFKPLHVQKPIGAYAKHFLLHLPSDKKFIVNLSQAQFTASNFFKSYKQHLVITRTLHKTFKSVKPYIKSLRKKIAAMSFSIWGS